MSNFKWGLRSLQNLSGIHPDLRKVADRALQLVKRRSQYGLGNQFDLGALV